MAKIGFLSVCAVALVLAVQHAAAEVPPAYIHQCSRRDPRLQRCYMDAFMHIRPWLANGIPEASVPSTEPFRLPELSLSLTGGPKGYRITLRDVDVRGVSNYTVQDLSVDSVSGSFSLDVSIPELTLVADYKSSGTLIMIPASGRGTLHGTLGRVRAQLSGTAAIDPSLSLGSGSIGSTSMMMIMAEGPARGGSRRFLAVSRLNVDLKVRDVQMHVERGLGESVIMTQATNMVLRTSGNLVLDAMMPELRLKLAEVFRGIANSIFSKVPVELLVRD